MDDALVDTNVAYIAERPEDLCALACIDALNQFTEDHRKLVLDRQGLILKEYLAQGLQEEPRDLGGQFIIWALDNQGNQNRCVQVDIHEDSDRGFEEFPDNPDLRRFDPSDRKFVAAAIAHGGKPEILTAADSEWREFADELARYVTVRELCAG